MCTLDRRKDGARKCDTTPLEATPMARADQNTMDIASLVDRSCLALLSSRSSYFSLFIGFGAGPVTGMSFGRACGARETDQR